MANPFLLAALEYEAKGFSVIPLKPKDKIPLIPSWTQFQVERADREQLGEWWRTWPTANLGILTGGISGGVYVIDTDSPEAASSLKPMLGPMEDVGISATGKGFHLFYHHGAPLQNKTGVLPQVDFRGDGGYVVAPPSVHASGKHYEWVKPVNGHLREIPPNFLELMQAAANPVQAARVRFDTAGALAGIPEGGRDEAIFKLAAKLRGADVPYEIALELCEQASANCSPPFLEARRKVDQAYKYSPGHTNARPQRQEDPTFWPMPMTAEKFLEAPDDDDTRWIWDKVIPFGEVAMLCGEPRAGKTTMALNLALAISRGVPFLGRKTVKSRCIYIAIDNSKRDMRVICEQIGFTTHDDVFLHVGKVPVRSTEWVLDIAVKSGAKFIVIDTLERFFEDHDVNKSDFAKAMYPLDLEAKRVGITPFYVHHATAKPPMDAKTGSLFMGHTTVKGMAPYYFELARVGDAKHRILSSDLRSGQNIEGMFISIDRETGWAKNGGNIDDALVEHYRGRILDFMADGHQSCRADIINGINGRRKQANIALASLVKSGDLEKVNPEINNGTKGHAEILVLAGTLVERENSVPAQLNTLF